MHAFLCCAFGSSWCLERYKGSVAIKGSENWVAHSREWPYWLPLQRSSLVLWRGNGKCCCPQQQQCSSVCGAALHCVSLGSQKLIKAPKCNVLIDGLKRESALCTKHARDLSFRPRIMTVMAYEVTSMRRGFPCFSPIRLQLCDP